MRTYLPAIAGLPFILGVAALAGCTTANQQTALDTPKPAPAAASLDTTMNEDAPKSSHAMINSLVSRYASYYKVPESLVHRVIRRESNYNPAARNRDYYGLMQIKPATARGMGYAGSPRGLLDAETNLKYAVRYLAGAYQVASGNMDRAVRFYARGYYYDAKRAGMLVASGLRPPPASEATLVASTSKPTSAALQLPQQVALGETRATVPATVQTVSATALPGVSTSARIVAQTSQEALLTVGGAQGGGGGTAMGFAGSTPDRVPLPADRPEGAY